MKRRSLMAAILVYVTSCAGSGADQPKQAASVPALRREASVCRRDVLPIVLVLLPSERCYRLNTEQLDSAGLATFFQDRLQKFPPELRNIYVRLDSGRAGELRWLVPAIERAGGRAFEPDSACTFVVY